MIIRTIMKSLTTVLAITLFNLLPLTVVHAQETPKSATSEKNAARAGAGKRTDVYHVHFTKAAVGKAVQLNDLAEDATQATDGEGSRSGG
jgi:hypothetical protein